ncbi:MAG: hypothetical protein MHPSP_003578, partial [Paramarteilia canceri]
EKLMNESRLKHENSNDSLVKERENTRRSFMSSQIDESKISQSEASNIKGIMKPVDRNELSILNSED